ncbi:MAG: hypothetical protein ACRD22_07380 [Terriglobia bacterium]
MVTMNPESSHLVHAEHIEKAEKEFRVEFDHPGSLLKDGPVPIKVESGTRWVRALAETPEGALEIAQYHYPTGSNFRLKPPEQRREQSFGMGY